MEGLRQEKRLVVLDLVLRTEYEYTYAYSVVKNFVGMHIHSKATAATQWGAMCNAEPPLLIRENAVQMDLVAKKTHAEEEGLLAPALSEVHLGFKTQLGFPQHVLSILLSSILILAMSAQLHTLFILIEQRNLTSFRTQRSTKICRMMTTGKGDGEGKRKKRRN